MKRFENYDQLPSWAKYIGSESGDGSIYERVADEIDAAIEPAYFKEDGIRHFFDVAVVIA